MAYSTSSVNKWTIKRTWFNKLMCFFGFHRHVIWYDGSEGRGTFHKECIYCGKDSKK
jgi:hypothetical protein